MTTENDQQERSTDMTDHDDHDDAAKSILLFCNLSPLVKRFGSNLNFTLKGWIVFNNNCNRQRQLWNFLNLFVTSHT